MSEYDWDKIKVNEDNELKYRTTLEENDTLTESTGDDEPLQYFTE